jgi:DNA-binding NarL/FixJ family response regulator
VGSGRILLVDDHVALVQLLEPLFTAQGYEVVGTATDGEQAVALATEHRPDLILMDLHMEQVDGVTATRRITAVDPDVRIVVYTFHSDPATTTAALQAGAAAFLAKGDTRLEEILEIVDQVAAGDTDLSSEMATAIIEGTDTAELTPRELEVLHAYATGAQSQKQVAIALGISRKTVENHLGSVYRKLDATSQLAAVLAAVRRGIIDLTPGGPLRLDQDPDHGDGDAPGTPA